MKKTRPLRLAGFMKADEGLIWWNLSYSRFEVTSRSILLDVFHRSCKSAAPGASSTPMKLRMRRR